MRLAVFAVLGGAALSLASVGCASSDCAEACSKLASCGIDAGTLPCDSACNNNFSAHSCAGCVNANSCDAIKHGCPPECPQVHF
jgi:hypothetical protein